MENKIPSPNELQEKESEESRLLSLEKSILKGVILKEKEFMELGYYLRNDFDRLYYYLFLALDNSENIINRMLTSIDP